MMHKLLLADDSITIQRVIELTFAEEDVQVLAVGDGKDAIDRIQSEPPDIVLADVGMPERDGYEVAAFIKGNPQLAHIPVLLLTGAFEPIDENRARAVGCDGVLVKPFEPQMVINRVKDLLGRRTGSSGSAGPRDAAGGSSAPGPEAASSADPGQQGGDSLEDYFDRLDAAFATLGSEPAGHAPQASPAAHAPAVAAAHPATIEDFASWDPELAGDASRPALHHRSPVVTAAPVAPAQVSPAPVEAVAPPPPAREPAEPPPAHATPVPGVLPAPVPVQSTTAMAPQIPLADAFAALLAAEQGQSAAPARARSAPTPSPDVVDEIVRRVIERLHEQDVRQTVVDVAERLVREEIERIKRANA